MARADKEFGKIRKIFWPIHKKECKLFFPMFAIYSLIVFVYSMLKPAKDALVITARDSGAQCIPFLKTWAILPLSILSIFIFTRLSNKYATKKIFYILIFGFLSFFLLFSFVLYPFRDVLHPHQTADFLQAHLPEGFKGLIAVFRNWTFTLFYAMSELWGTIIMTVLFWGFANEATSVKVAKRFYAILGVGANLATILAGFVSHTLSSSSFHNIIYRLPGNRWERTLQLETFVIIIISITTVLLFHYLNQHLEKINQENSVKSVKEEKPKMSLRENFNYLRKSKYLICIALIVLAFNLTLNIIEIVWKDQIQHLYPNPADYSAYMSRVMSYIGILSSFISIFICGNVIRGFGWTVAALLTPITILITGTLFFGSILFQDQGFGALASFIGLSPLFMIVSLGSLQNILSRASKFTFFDVTKEISFIPLSRECKLKGKAAIDGVGSRLGKSGGSIIHQFLLIIFASLSASTPYLAIILLLVVAIWIGAVKSLGNQFQELTTNNEKLEVNEEETTSSKEEPLTTNTIT